MMDDEVTRADAGGTEADAGPAHRDAPELPELPEAVTANADEVRRLIEAGASSPEELRELAARIRDHRALERSLWRSEVRPALLKSKKGPFRLGDLRDPAADSRRASQGLRLGLAVLAVVAVFVLAASQSSALWVLVPVAAVLVYAYRLGGQGGNPPDADPPT